VFVMCLTTNGVRSAGISALIVLPKAKTSEIYKLCQSREVGSEMLQTLFRG